MGIVQEHDLRVIEDVAQSAGGSFKGQRLGSFGDVGALACSITKSSPRGREVWC